MLDHLRLMYDYNAWANRRILDAAAHLTPEQLHTEGSASFGSIFATLVHTLESEWYWLGVWQGTDMMGVDGLRPADFADLAALRERWEAVAAELRAFVAALEPEGEGSPARVVRWRYDTGEARSQRLWPLMLHVVTHGTQHRSEIATMLTAFGHSPGGMDILYLPMLAGLV